MKNQLLNRQHRLWLLGCALALAALPALAESSYTYPRVLDGPASLTLTSGETEGVDLHQPILVGDRIRVPRESRLELVLADRSLLRLGGDVEIDFEAIAFSAETEDRATVLRLHVGEAQLVVPEDVLGDVLPRLETPGATIYVHRAGSFRITAGDGGWTELVVRDGLAELVTDRGSLRVHPGEQGRVRGGSQPRLELGAAEARNSLERWGDWLSAEAVRADVPYVDESLRYAARPLADHGTWVEIDHRRAWRPTTAVDWRPYVHGYWRETPIGLTWVSQDPWGYVTHHYGSWDLEPSHGWVWYPGAAYARARVHWYWGPKYVGWCPSGYYRNHYARHRRGHGLSLGLYGWAGGSWNPFRHWSFTLHANFGHRHQRRHVHRGAHFARQHGHRLDRGLITTEPRGRRGRRHDTFTELRREAERRERTRGRPLPDVTDFVARKPLPDDLERAVLKPRRALPPRVATPVEPATPVRRALPPRVATPVEPAQPSVRRTLPPRVATPVEPATPVRRALPPRVATPLEPSSRVDTPRAERPRPAVRPRPAPRVNTPRVEPPRPAVRPRPAPSPRVNTPRAERPRPTARPAPSPRVNTPRAERPRPTARPAPSPRVSRPRAARPAPTPRVAPPRTPRPRPTARPAPAPRPKPSADRVRSERPARPQAKAPERAQPEKKAASRREDSRSRRRDD